MGVVNVTRTEFLLTVFLLFNLACVILTTRFVFSFVEVACLVSFLSFCLVSPLTQTPLSSSHSSVLNKVQIIVVLYSHHRAIEKLNKEHQRYRDAMRRISLASYHEARELRHTIRELNALNDQLSSTVRFQVARWEASGLDEEMWVAL